MKNTVVLSVEEFSFDHKNKFFKPFEATFKPGTLNFIQGKNGTGKSTLMRIIRGSIEHSEKATGTIIINNAKHALKDGLQRQHEIGFVAQNTNLMVAPHLDFLTNLRLACCSTYPGLKSLPEVKLMPDFIKDFGIPLDRPGEKLSGGQRQVLAILMAIQKSPSVLLLDEPTAALDESNSYTLMKFLQELAHTYGMTIILIVHDKELVQTFAPEGYFELIKDHNNGLRTLQYTDQKQ